jgi:hypothetical protein
MRRVPDPPQVIVQRLTDAINKQDLEGVTALLAANCVVAVQNGGTESVGAPALRSQYEALFEERPKARVSVLGRMALGETVIQHESIGRGLGAAEKRIVIYTVVHEKVTRLDLIR